MSKSPHSESAEDRLPSGRDIPLPWHLRFPAALEREFRQHLRVTSRPILLIACPLLLLIMLIAFLLEHHVAPEVVAQSWRPRLLTVFATCAVLFITWRQDYQHYQNAAVAGMLLIFALTHAHLGVSIAHPLSSVYFYIALLSVLLMASLFRLVLHHALALTILILGVAGAGLFLLRQGDLNEHLIIFSFMVAASVISLAGQYFHERLQRQFFLAESILALHRNELQSANLVLENQAAEDGLTGVANRRSMDAQLGQLMHRMRHKARGAPDSISVLLFDIDDFKPFNDTYGHQAGDKCLQHVASIPKSMIQRASDFVARYGGEEFVVVLNGTHLGDALVFAEKLRARIEQLGIPHSASRTGGTVTISVGVACTNTDCLDVATLIEHADRALYVAKSAGRNRVASFNADGEIRLHNP